MFDWASSVIVFIGYAIPGFAMGIVLLVLFGGGSYWDVFPLGGLQSEGYDNFSTWGKIQDRFNHRFYRFFCYMVGSFASTTVLMKTP